MVWRTRWEENVKCVLTNSRLGACPNLSAAKRCLTFWKHSQKNKANFRSVYSAGESVKCEWTVFGNLLLFWNHCGIGYCTALTGNLWVLISLLSAVQNPSDITRVSLAFQHGHSFTKSTSVCICGVSVVVVVDEVLDTNQKALGSNPIKLSGGRNLGKFFPFSLSYLTGLVW